MWIRNVTYFEEDCAGGLGASLGRLGVEDCPLPPCRGVFRFDGPGVAFPWVGVRCEEVVFDGASVFRFDGPGLVFPWVGVLCEEAVVDGAGVFR